MTEQKHVVTAKSAGQFDELSASVWHRGMREGHLRLTLEQLKGVRAFYSEPPLSRHFAATVAELDALIAEQESELAARTCNKCGRVECVCGS